MIEMDYTDITGIFKEKLKIDNIVKTILSVFLNSRYLSKIDYKPYFQRNYVWDDEKASYFIESVFLGTEIPPIVLFQTHSKNEVIDGRQRFETISRFLNDKLILKESGLHSLKILAGKKYSQLEDDIKESFEATRIRIIQFSVVDEPKLSEEQEDKIKKEIFRRYNSGITPLQKYDIERAAYINDKLSKKLDDTIYNSDELYDFLNTIILPRSKKKATKRDKVNILTSLSRELMTMPYVPINSYSNGSSKSEIIGRYYEKYVKNDKDDEIIRKIDGFKNNIFLIKGIYKYVTHQKLKDNNLFYECLYWAVDSCRMENNQLNQQQLKKVVQIILNAENNPKLWVGVSNLHENKLDALFEPTGSHYYSAINNRYTFISNAFVEAVHINISNHLKGKQNFDKVMMENFESEELKRYKLNKPLPETLSILDILSDMDKNRFLIRPEYQRSEVKNIAKASYLMESVMLGIKIPPLFIYKRDDKVKEVVDGQQRLLTIIGFLGKTYLNERGERVSSDKDRFKLGNLKILTELKGKNIEAIGEDMEARILDFPIDVIEILHEQNPDFSPIDLFLRLNTKPYPIKDNTFEMWNAYCDKSLIVQIKKLADEYNSVVYRPKDPRMRLEELLTSLAYLDYKTRVKKEKIENVLNIYKRYNRMNARIKDKSNVTKTLSDVSNASVNDFLASIENIGDFSMKIKVLTEESHGTVKLLFSHQRKGAAFKTDQNFYFLWVLLNEIPLQVIKNNAVEVFDNISKIFGIIQNTPEYYSIDQFINTQKEFKAKYFCGKEE